jgi:hypothetical protein
LKRCMFCTGSTRVETRPRDHRESARQVPGTFGFPVTDPGRRARLAKHAVWRSGDSPTRRVETRRPPSRAPRSAQSPDLASKSAARARASTMLSSIEQ